MQGDREAILDLGYLRYLLVGEKRYDRIKQYTVGDLQRSPGRYIRFGAGGAEVEFTVQMMVTLGERVETLQLDVIKGPLPLLFGLAAAEKFGLAVDCAAQTVLQGPNIVGHWQEGGLISLDLSGSFCVMATAEHAQGGATESERRSGVMGAALLSGIDGSGDDKSPGSGTIIESGGDDKSPVSGTIIRSGGADLERKIDKLTDMVMSIRAALDQEGFGRVNTIVAPEAEAGDLSEAKSRELITLIGDGSSGDDRDDLSKSADRNDGVDPPDLGSAQFDDEPNADSPTKDLFRSIPRQGSTSIPDPTKRDGTSAALERTWDKVLRGRRGLGPARRRVQTPSSKSGIMSQNGGVRDDSGARQHVVLENKMPRILTLSDDVIRKAHMSNHASKTRMLSWVHAALRPGDRARWRDELLAFEQRVCAVVDSCQACAANAKQVYAPGNGVPDCESKFNDTVMIDVMVLDNAAQQYALVIVDLSTGDIALSYLDRVNAECVVLEYYIRWVCQNGQADRVISDVGGEMTGHIANLLFSLFGEEKLTTAAKASSSHGRVERVTQTLRWTIERFTYQRPGRKTRLEWRVLLSTWENQLRSEVQAGGYSSSERSTGRRINVERSFMHERMVASSLMSPVGLGEVQTAGLEAYRFVRANRALGEILSARARPESSDEVIPPGALVDYFTTETSVRGRGGGARKAQWCGPARNLGFFGSDPTAATAGYYRIEHNGTSVPRPRYHVRYSKLSSGFDPDKEPEFTRKMQAFISFLEHKTYVGFILGFDASTLSWPTLSLLHALWSGLLSPAPRRYFVDLIPTTSHCITMA